MTTPFSTFGFVATSAPTPRTLPDRLADFVNVRDFGAVGDNANDDTLNIQAAFDAAWGGPAPNSNWLSGHPEFNRPVYFPAGRYRVTDTLRIWGIHGAMIIGDGSRATSIRYDGASYPNTFPITGLIKFSSQPANGSSITLNGTTVLFGIGGVAIGADLQATMANLATFLNASSDAQIVKCIYAAITEQYHRVDSGFNDSILIDAKTTSIGTFTLAASTSPASNATVSGGTLTSGDKTSLIFTNGFGYAHVDSISFIITSGHSALADNTVCFNWNWNNIVQAHTSALTFTDVGFSGGTYGLLTSDTSPTLPAVSGYDIWGYQGDTLNIINCWVDSCTIGVQDNNANSIFGVIAGCSITNCTDGLGNGIGIHGNKSGPQCIIGITFAGNDLDLELLSQATVFVGGCHTTSPNFCGAVNIAIVGCTQSATAGIFCNNISGFKGLSIDNCYSSNGTIGGSGNTYLRNNSFSSGGLGSGLTIRELKTEGALTFATLPSGAAEGLLCSISDCNVAGWSNTAGGSGSNHVAVRYDGTNWKVVGK